MTARLSRHAQQRCREMGLSTKVAKRIVRAPDVSWTGADGQTVATCDAFPEVTVVHRGDVVITVLWRTPDEYDRATYRPDTIMSSDEGTPA